MIFKGTLLSALWLAAAAAAQPPDWAAVRGVNYFTAGAGNAHEMWSRLDPAAPGRELAWARSLGFNSLRLWLSVQAYESSPATFERNLDMVLTAAAKQNLTAMLVLFDNCGLAERKDAVEMKVAQAYQRFLQDAKLPDAEKQRIRRTYGEFAQGSGADMLVPVGSGTPPDILFWHRWSPNPGLARMGRDQWPRLEKYVDAVVNIARRHPNVIAFDLFNEPGVIFELPPGMKRQDADALTTAFIEQFAAHLRTIRAPAALTIGSESIERMKAVASLQDVLSVHSYRLGDRLDEFLRQAKDAARAAGKPVLVTETLANTDNWLDVRHAEQSRSTDEGQLKHYQDNLPRLLKSGLGWYSWGFIAGRMFTPFTDIVSSNGYRRPAANYLQAQLRQTAKSVSWPNEKALYEVNVEYYPNHSFKELSADMPRLKDLGINVVYIMPFWEAVAGQRYLITDYHRIDPRYGTPEDLKQLVENAHRHGIRVLLDLVTSLTYDGTWIQKEHPDFILVGDKGDKQRFYPFNAWGWALDCAKPEVIEYFAGIARHYVEQFGIDGWRIDSPMNNYDPAKVSTDHSRLNLLRAVKASVTSVKPDALFVCEISGPTLMWGKDDDNEVPAFDEICQASYHYAFAGFLGGKKESGFHYVFFEGSPAYGKIKTTTFDRVAQAQATSAELVEAVHKEPLLHGAMRANFTENHDTERVAYAFPDRHRALFLLAATLPGVPVVHAGQETGTTNPAGHYDRKPPVSPVIPWKERDRDLEAFYKKVLAVREQNRALVNGDIANALAEDARPYAFLRTSGSQQVLVVVNMESKAMKAAVKLPAPSGTLSDLLTGQTQPFREARASLDLPSFGYRLMRVDK